MALRGIGSGVFTPMPRQCTCLILSECIVLIGGYGDSKEKERKLVSDEETTKIETKLSLYEKKDSRNGTQGWGGVVE